MTAVAERRAHVRTAVVSDWPAIARLRDDYYARREQPVQARSGATWYVATIGDDVLAVQSWLEDAANRQRWIMDTYCDPSRLGRLALKALVEFTHTTADAQGVTLMGVTEEDNAANRAVMEARGWMPVGVLLTRPPKEA